MAASLSERTLIDWLLARNHSKSSAASEITINSACKTLHNISSSLERRYLC